MEKPGVHVLLFYSYFTQVLLYYHFSCMASESNDKSKVWPLCHFSADKRPDEKLKLRIVCLFDLILYVPSTIFQLNREGSSWVEPVLS